LIENAAKRLATNGVPTRKNAMKYASLLKQGKSSEAEAFLANFRARSRKSNKKSAKKATEAAVAPSPYAAAGNNSGAKPAKAKKTEAKAAPNGNNGATKKRKSPSAAQKAYFEALRTARATLGAFGKPKPSNMSRWASLKVSKKSNAAASLAKFEENFKGRVSAAPAAAPKAAAKKSAAKPLTAVNEAPENNNNNSNSMQGYSENFESESSNE
jgi:hypothetical protein